MSYEDILYQPHHVSPRRANMPLMDRAAQFAPFAALSGHDGLIRETARLTEPFLELTDSKQAELDEILQRLQPGMQLRLTHFVPDLRKEGGRYAECVGILRKVDDYTKCLKLAGDIAVPFRFLLNLEIVG